MNSIPASALLAVLMPESIKPWRFSQFCENYRQFARRLKRSMRQVHRAGEKLFID